MFTLKAQFEETDEQARVVSELTRDFRTQKNQTLLGVTGSGKTFTMANLIRKIQMPTLIVSHNKTLAAQLYQEMRDFFPQNAVSYFVSYYDYYQPEAYIPQSDTYIEKEAQINQQIDKLRLLSTTNILTRKDVIICASVSCIYNIGSPLEYGKFVVQFSLGDTIDRKTLFARLVDLQYERNEFDFKRGTFRVRGDSVDVYLAYEDFGYRLHVEADKLVKISKFDPLTGATVDESMDAIIIYPAKQYLADPQTFLNVEGKIRSDLEIEYNALKKENKLVEAQRLLKKVNYDLEMIKEVGYVNGIENYSRYLDQRAPGATPFSLIHYFNHRYGSNWLAIIDESHMTIPQVGGMYNGDVARKKTLIDFGFRLKAAYDNRPLKFQEFYSQVPHFLYVSATPNIWELEKSGSHVAELLVRPTGVIDPTIIIKPGEGEIPDLIKEIEKRVKKSERTLVTTLTKKTAEDLSIYLKEKGIKAEYLHSDIKTLERLEILNKLRKKDFDVLIGINLLREGLDLPEVTLVAILDADKEGFLRSKTSLIQTMGRAARNIGGTVIMYADVKTGSMDGAIKEVERRRNYQISYNTAHHITPTTILKDIKERIVESLEDDSVKLASNTIEYLSKIDEKGMTPLDRKKIIKNLTSEMKRQANAMNFELAIAIREKIKELELE